MTFASASAGAASHTKVNLARLLRSCEQLSASLSAPGVSQGSSTRRADRRRFETYLSVLQRMWHDLANSSGDEAPAALPKAAAPQAAPASRRYAR